MDFQLLGQTALLPSPKLLKREPLNYGSNLLSHCKLVQADAQKHTNKDIMMLIYPFVIFIGAIPLYLSQKKHDSQQENPPRLEVAFEGFGPQASVGTALPAVWLRETKPFVRTM